MKSPRGTQQLSVELMTNDHFANIILVRSAENKPLNKFRTKNSMYHMFASQ